MAVMMEHVIRQFLDSGAGGAEPDEEQLVDLLENHLEEEMAQAESEGEAQRMFAQEQVQYYCKIKRCHTPEAQRVPAQEHDSITVLQRVPAQEQVLL
jgi:DNA replication protein DnaC